MSSIPSEIPEIGSTGQKLRQNPAFDPLRAGISSEDYFVWSRVDGATTLRDLLLMTGLPPERAVQIVRRLRGLGAVLLPGETATPSRPRVDTTAGPGPGRPPAPGAPSSPTSSSSTGSSSTGSSSTGSSSTASSSKAGARPTPDPGRDARNLRGSDAPTVPRATSAPIPIIHAPPAAVVDVLPDPRPDELAALAEPGDLDDADRRRILAMERRIAASDGRGILGVGASAEKRDIKRAYFVLSKEFHPDRFYGRRLGSFARRLASVFEAITQANDELTTAPRRRREASPSQEPQTPQEYAADLFARACSVEVGGDPAGALKLFDAAIRVDAQVRYLRRAASCALQARQLRVAEEYAKKATNIDPGDPSTARLLAAAFRAGGKLADAEEVLILAMALKNENDVLAAELRSDLTEVRRQLAARGG